MTRTTVPRVQGLVPGEVRAGHAVIRAARPHMVIYSPEASMRLKLNDIGYMVGGACVRASGPDQARTSLSLKSLATVLPKALSM
jgi:hypothetical protein